MPKDTPLSEEFSVLLTPEQRRSYIELRELHLDLEKYTAEYMAIIRGLFRQAYPKDEQYNEQMENFIDVTGKVNYYLKTAPDTIFRDEVRTQIPYLFSEYKRIWQWVLPLLKAKLLADAEELAKHVKVPPAKRNAPTR